ncbi:hypothetical protein HZA33_03715 [Candidatus Pacearchaeota archaeon]|nr:hypothetical protein [Candidatus Pacearchaeota archaeon]
MNEFNFSDIDSMYNKVPAEISTKQKNMCNRCYYRIYNLQLDAAKEEAKRKGGSIKDYMQGFYIKEEAIRECKRKKCILEEKARKEPSQIIVIAKNSCLRERILQIIKDKKLNGKIIEVRGEDVPQIIDKGNNNTIGITGEDLFKEYVLENYSSKLEVVERVPWQDDKAVYGKPIICLLGKKGKTIEQMKGKLKVGINKKYRKIAKRYLNTLELKGYNFEKSYFLGSTEEIFQLGLIDLIIDIVYSGSSAKKAGLEIFDKIFESDIVIIRRQR